MPVVCLPPRAPVALGRLVRHRQGAASGAVAGRFGQTLSSGLARPSWVILGGVGAGVGLPGLVLPGGLGLLASTPVWLTVGVVCLARPRLYRLVVGRGGHVRRRRQGP